METVARMTASEIAERELFIVELIRQKYPFKVIVGMVAKEYTLTDKGAKLAVKKCFNRMTKNFHPSMIRLRAMEYLESIKEDILGARRSQDWGAVESLERLYGNVLGILRPEFKGILLMAIKEAGGLPGVEESGEIIPSDSSPAASSTFQKLLQAQNVFAPSPVRVLSPAEVTVNERPDTNQG